LRLTPAECPASIGIVLSRATPLFTCLGVGDELNFVNFAYAIY
jgi:hypothetical protein